jgi:hypothetical protein
MIDLEQQHDLDAWLQSVSVDQEDYQMARKFANFLLSRGRPEQYVVKCITDMKTLKMKDAFPENTCI